MKTTFILLILNITFCFSQNLTLDEASSLRTKSIGEVEETLTSKNWTLLNAEAPKDGKDGLINFAFSKNSYDDKALAFLWLIYSETTTVKRVEIQINKKEFYDKYIARIKSLGCKLITSKVKDGEIVKVYRGKSTTFEVTVTTNKELDSETKTVYYLYITSNSDYIKNFKE